MEVKDLVFDFWFMFYFPTLTFAKQGYRTFALNYPSTGNDKSISKTSTDSKQTKTCLIGMISYAIAILAFQALQLSSPTTTTIWKNRLRPPEQQHQEKQYPINSKQLHRI